MFPAIWRKRGLCRRELQLPLQSPPALLSQKFPGRPALDFFRFRRNIGVFVLESGNQGGQSDNKKNQESSRNNVERHMVRIGNRERTKNPTSIQQLIACQHIIRFDSATDLGFRTDFFCLERSQNNTNKEYYYCSNRSVDSRY